MKTQLHLTVTLATVLLLAAIAGSAIVQLSKFQDARLDDRRFVDNVLFETSRVRSEAEVVVGRVATAAAIVVIVVVVVVFVILLLHLFFSSSSFSSSSCHCCCCCSCCCCCCSCCSLLLLLLLLYFVVVRSERAKERNRQTEKKYRA